MSEFCSTVGVNSERELTSRVLVVDDEAVLRGTIATILEKNGFQTAEAENGQEAFACLQQSSFDLVITDLSMPVADGRFLLKKMAEHCPDTPRIVLAASDSDTDIMLALKTGAYDYFVKPLNDFDRLILSVKRAIERKRLHDQRSNTISQMEHINQVISMLNRGKDIDDIFHMLTASLWRIIEFNLIAVFDYLEEENSFVVRFVDSDRPPSFSRGDVFQFPFSLAEGVAHVDEVTIISDLHAFFANRSFPSEAYEVLTFGFISLVITPLIADGRITGYLALASVERDYYTSEDARFLKAIAGQIALSIERGRLISALEEHTRDLEKVVKVRTREVLNTQKTTIFALSKLAEVRDNDTGMHLDRIRNYCLYLAQIMQYSGDFSEITKKFLENIYDSSILHDVGKVGIPDAVLLKPAKLTENEYELMKTHTSIGAVALSDASHGLGDDSFLKMSKEVALCHHECWDGSGYPDGRKGEEIPLAARIVTICDIYDALTTERSYKSAFSHEEALAIICEESYRFDPKILALFIKNGAEFNQIRRDFS